MIKTPNKQTSQAAERAVPALTFAALLGVAATILLILYPFREILPAADLGIVTVTATAPGTSSKALLSSFTAPAEHILDELPGLESYTSRTSDGYAEITVTTNEKTSSDTAAKQIRAALKSTSVPATVDALSTSMSETVQIYLSALSGDRLRSTAERLKSSLSALPAVLDVSISSDPPPVGVRLNGREAVRVAATKHPGADILSMLDKIRRATTALSADVHGLEIFIDDKAVIDFTHRIHVTAAAAAAALFAFGLVAFALMNGYTPLLVAIPFSLLTGLLSLAVLRLLGVSINNMTLLTLIGVSLIALTVETTLIGYSRRPTGSGIRRLILPLGLSLLAAVASVAPLPAAGSVLGGILKGGLLTVIVVLLVSAAVSLTLTPQILPLFPPAPVAKATLYRRFLAALFARRSLRIAAWIMPQAAVLYMILFVTQGLGQFHFFPQPEQERVSVWAFCDSTDTSEGAAPDRPLRRIDRSLAEREDVERVLLREGIASGPRTSAVRYGPGYSEMEITLRPSRPVPPVLAQLEKVEKSPRCELHWAAASPGGFTQPDALTISGPDAATVQQAARALEESIPTLIPYTSARLERTPDAVLHKNGLPTATIYVEPDNGLIQNEALEQVAQGARSHYPSCVFEADLQRQRNSKSMKRFGRAAALVILLIVLIHLFAALQFRALFSGLILFSPAYFVAGAFLFNREIFIMSLAVVPFLAAVLGMTVFVHCAAVKEAGKKLDRETGTDACIHLFQTTAPLLAALLIGAFVFLWTVPFFITAAKTLIGGLPLLAYFLWVLLPLGIRTKIKQ